MKNILAIHGLSSCGKSTTIRLLCEYLHDHKHYSTGDRARAMAKEAGMTIEQYMIHARQNGIPIDAILDDSLKALSYSEDNWIVDSRLAYYHLEPGCSFNVYLFGDVDIVAGRRLKDLQHGEDAEKYKHFTVEDVKQLIIGRDEKDMKKYSELYPLTNCNDKKNYHLAIDTTKTSLNHVATHIQLSYYQWREGKFDKPLLVSGNHEIQYL